MANFLSGLHPVIQALLAGIFTWSITGAGALCIFVTRTVNQKVMDSMLGFAAGVMMAATFWSLLAPAIELSQGSWVPAASGFFLGAVFLRLLDLVLPHLHLGFPMEAAEGIKTSWKRSTLLVAAITLHNIPEGLAVGVAFGAVAAKFPSATLAGAVALAIGIGIQDFPEGFAVAVPLRREGMSRFKSFWYGMLSGIVEPLGAVFGAWAVLAAKPLLPYALGFAAGAMFFVVVEEVIPECQHNGNTEFATGGAVLGFLTMMILDVAFS